MRLTRPTLSSPVVVTCDSRDLPGNLLNTSLKNDITSTAGAETLAIGQFLLVPQSFGLVFFCHRICRYSFVLTKPVYVSQEYIFGRNVFVLYMRSQRFKWYCSECNFKGDFKLWYRNSQLVRTVRIYFFDCL